MIVLPVTYTQRAERHFVEIARYIARQSGSRRIAENYVGRIRRLCDGIGGAPFCGEPYPEERFRPFRRIGFERSATVVFSVLEDRVLIVGIYRKGRDVVRHL